MQVYAGPRLGLNHDSCERGLTRNGGANSCPAGGFRVTKSDDGAAVLAVRLIRSGDANVVWSGDYPVANSDAATIGEKIAEAVISALP